MIVCRAELLLLGLERLLAPVPDLKVFTYSRLPAAQADLSEPAALTARSRVTRVALMSDRQAPEVVGDVARALASLADEVVLLSSRPDMSILLGSMGAGARSFVMEGDDPETLLAAVRSAARHRTFMGQRTLEVLVDWLAGQERARGLPARRRDDDLLRLLAEGRSTHDIADRLGVAPKTVRNRVSQLYRRLGVHSRAAAVRLAEEQGLLDPGDSGRRGSF
jgi:DNA-binding NarL/FixJ family response regulator